MVADSEQHDDEDQPEKAVRDGVVTVTQTG
jgi:hypothetical protein